MKAKISLHPDAGTFYLSATTDSGKTIFTAQQTGRAREFRKAVEDLQADKGLTVTQIDDNNYSIEEVSVAKVTEPATDKKPAE